MAKYSLGEIDALAKKATRGAGYSWGIAEEVGKATRWLSAYGFLGAEALAQHLLIVADEQQAFMPSLIKTSPQEKIFGNQQAIVDQEALSYKKAMGNKDATLCALSCGALMNDLGHHIEANKTLSFGNMLFPILALPAAGRIAEACGISVSFSYSDTVIICDPYGIAIKDTPPLLSTFDLVKNANVICNRIESNIDNTHFPSPQSRAIETEALKILEKFAHSTYAPATEESRLKGAGEG